MSFVYSIFDRLCWIGFGSVLVSARRDYTHARRLAGDRLPHTIAHTTADAVAATLRQVPRIRFIRGTTKLHQSRILLSIPLYSRGQEAEASHEHTRAFLQPCCRTPRTSPEAAIRAPRQVNSCVDIPLLIGRAASWLGKRGSCPPLPLRPGIAWMRGSMVTRIRPCMT